MNIEKETNEPEEASPRIATFSEFYLYYLREHSDATCRRLHYIGTTLTLIIFAMAIILTPWWLLAAPVAGYGFAWYAHFFIEKNRPATFTYPLWSLASDYIMFFSWLSGKLPTQLRKAGVVE